MKTLKHTLLLSALVAVCFVISITYAQQAQQASVRYETCPRCNGTGKNLCTQCGGNKCAVCNYSGVQSLGEGWMAMGVPNAFTCTLCKGSGKRPVDTRFEGCFRTYFGNDKGYLCGDAHPIGRVVIVDSYESGKVLKKYTRAEWNKIEADDKAVIEAEKAKKADDEKARGITNKRYRGDIENIIVQKGKIVRNTYYERRQEGSIGEGKIVIKFTINEFGKVTSVQMIESTINDSKLENMVISSVKNWDFGKINEPGDLTEFTYSFNFVPR